MKRHDEIVSLMQTLGAGFRLHPEETEKKLNILTDVQQENLVRLLKRIADGNVHTVDNAAYRLAKFRTEFGNYAEVDSFLFYYIFTELFLIKV